jgi:excisionase family DNA binding protein
VERLLTAEEAAKLLNVKVNTLVQWRANRARLRPLPYIRSGLKVCYRESDIAKYLDVCDHSRAAEEETPPPQSSRGVERS